MQSGWSVRANWFSSRWRAVGGHLTVADQALQFEPHRVASTFGGESLVLSLSDIESVTVAPRRPFRNLGGSRRQLLIQANGDRFYFVVNRVERVAEDLRGASRG